MAANQVDVNMTEASPTEVGSSSLAAIVCVNFSSWLSRERPLPPGQVLDSVPVAEDGTPRRTSSIDPMKARASFYNTD